MNFSDILKKSVMEGFSYPDLSTVKIIITLVMTCLMAVYIFFTYKMVTKSSFYVKSFHISMAVISIITAGIILAMQSSIVISLGMVGALSIVRFRTAVKDPMDLLFLFWSIGTGIICGAGLYKIAVIMAVLVTAGILILDMLPVRTSPYLLIVNADNTEIEEEIICLLKAAGTCRMRSKNITANGLDLILEVKTKKEKELVEKISMLKGITSVSLLAHDGNAG